jgi:phosphomannomutase
LVANLASQSDVPISELVAPIHRYIASGEINSRVADPEDVLKRLQEAYPGGRMLHLDGLSIEFEDWWFNVRASNTEPLIRLNLEAKTRQMMEQRRDEVLGVVRGLKSEE